MKKLLIFVFILILTFSFCACSNNAQSETSDNPDEKYVIEDLLFEKNIDELKKQYPEHSIMEFDNLYSLTLNSKLGNVDGSYIYNIENEQIIKTLFRTTATDTEEIDKVLDELYIVLTEKYFFTNMPCRGETINHQHKEFGNVTTKEDFNKYAKLTLEKNEESYSSIIFSGITSDSKHIFSVSIISYDEFLEITVNVVR